MYYFTIKNNTIYDNDDNVSSFKNNLSLYVFDYVNGILYEKKYLHNTEFLLRKTTLNNILEYFSTYDRRIQWNYFEEFEDFNKCNEIIIEWDFHLDGDSITFLQNILYKAITEIRNQKINQIIMYYFKIKINKYNYYCIENNMLYTQQTYADYYELNIDDLMVTNKFYTHIKEYSNKVDFYTENIFDYSLSKLSYNDFLRQIVSSILRDIKISKLLE